MKKVFMVLVFFALAAMVSTPVLASGKTGAKNCSDFDTQKQAQNYYDSHSTKKNPDPSDLDRDKDGKACESLPSSHSATNNQSTDSEHDNDSTAAKQNHHDNTNNNNNNSSNAKSGTNSNNHAKGQSSHKSGGEMPSTSSEYPLGVLVGILVAGFGAVLFAFRKKASAE